MGHLILPNTPSLADAAFQYASLGWPVLPLYEPVGDRCSCGRSSCSSPGKHPRTRHGLKEVAAAVGLSPSSFSRLIHGHRNVDPRLLEAIEEAIKAPKTRPVEPSSEPTPEDGAA